MNQAVEILLIIGILVNLIKGADLILRPHQQKWLQDRFETLTLYLDYTKPLEAYQLKTKDNISWIMYCAFLSFILSFVSVIYIDFRWHVILIPAMSALAVQGTAWAAYFLRNTEYPKNKMEKTRMKLVETSTEWLTNSKTTTQLLFRPILLILATASLTFGIHIFLVNLSRWFKPSEQVIRIAMICLGLLIPLMMFNWRGLLRKSFPFGTLPRSVLRLGSLARDGFTASTLVMVVMGLGAISVIILTASLIIFVIDLVLKFIRGLAWRITEYNKGVFAAIILIITVALGVAEFYLKTKNPIPSPVTPVTTPAQTFPQPPNSNSP